MTMPIPKPEGDETEEHFVGRCVGMLREMGEFEDDSQRAAICHQQWRDAKGERMSQDEVGLKAIGALEVKDADKGEVTAVVANLNTVDRDQEVIMLGAMPEQASVKLSQYAHDTVRRGEPPVGKGVVTLEGDRAVFRGRFFLSTTRGREAFETTKEMGGEQEWSIGFQIHESAPASEEWKSKGARRLLTRITPFEVSPVLIGAGVATGTVRVKTFDLTQMMIPLSLMETLCPGCAKEMLVLGVTAVRVKQMPEQMMTALCEKFGAGEGFRTRCMEASFGEFESEDRGAFCNWLEQECGLASARAAALEQKAKDDAAVVAKQRTDLAAQAAREFERLERTRRKYWP